MIICRTPLRVSFFGGGTDYPTWVKEHGGQVLSTTIDKYCYVTCRKLPPFFDHKYRIAYSKIEHRSNIDGIEHPVVRECIRKSQVEDGLEIHYDSDLPARTGLGSSSAFTVAMLNTLATLQGQTKNKMDLATEAIHMEQHVLKETVGYQDQTSAAHGGFNHITFHTDERISVQPLDSEKARLKDLNKHLILFYTGISRFASDVAKDQVKKTTKNAEQLHHMHQLVDTAIDILQSKRSLTQFGDLLDETWQLKRSLSTKISLPIIDDKYAQARAVGARGGKLLGAGGGGFLLFFAEPDLHPALVTAMHPFVPVRFSFENEGSQIVRLFPKSN